MIKNSLSFLAGTVFSTGIVICGGGRPAAMLALGFLLTVSVGAGVLWLTGVRRLARFLNAFADGVLASSDQNSARQASSARQPRTGLHVADKSGYVKPSRKAQLQNMADAVEEYREKVSDEYRERASKPTAEYSKTTDAVLAEMFGKGKVA